MNLILQCLFSPRLYKIYRDGPRESEYTPNRMEKMGDKIVKSAKTVFNICFYTSPFICMYIYKRGFFNAEEMNVISHIMTSVGCLVAFSLGLRAYGRACNPKYLAFLKALSASNADTDVYLNNIRKYDFDFSVWPVGFEVERKQRPFRQHPFTMCANKELPKYKRIPLQILAYIAVHTFALRLIYPGCLSVIYNLLGSVLFQGRTQLVELYNGIRNKLATADGNFIDTMFVDKRQESGNGKHLVICCEGNSGYYEIGIMTIPIKCGYSVIGWNHPGFAGSTGLPFPTQETNAIDAVMQYAIVELNFKPNEIILFGWSIGGYAATWAAVHYPVRALVLDATFDDLLPIAQNQMPTSWAPLVKEVVRSYVDLNIVKMMREYEGPVHMVRRSDDEVICLRPGQIGTNRLNYLLLDMIMDRNPYMFDDAISTKLTLKKYLVMPETQRLALDTSTLPEKDKTLLNMISMYTHDFRGTHCAPLPEHQFEAIMERINTQRD